MSLKLVRKIHDTVEHTYVRPSYSFKTLISVGLAQARTNIYLCAFLLPKKIFLLILLESGQPTEPLSREFLCRELKMSPDHNTKSLWVRTCYSITHCWLLHFSDHYSTQCWRTSWQTPLLLVIMWPVHNSNKVSVIDSRSCDVCISYSSVIQCDHVLESHHFWHNGTFVINWNRNVLVKYMSADKIMQVFSGFVVML